MLNTIFHFLNLESTPSLALGAAARSGFTYKGQSCLENMHCAITFGVLRSTGTNFLNGFEQAEPATQFRRIEGGMG